ncbi:MAG: hypothetical protein V3U75_06145 [Methylococcaceae bacterium]
MLTCKEINYLATKKLDSKLTWREQMGFWLHTALCSLCRRYVKDVQKLHAVMLKAGQSGRMLFPESVKLSEYSRERIKQALNKALHRSE